MWLLKSTFLKLLLIGQNSYKILWRAQIKILFIFCQRSWSVIYLRIFVLLNSSSMFCILLKLSSSNNIEWHLHKSSCTVKFTSVLARWFLFGQIKKMCYIVSGILARVFKKYYEYFWLTIIIIYIYVTQRDALIQRYNLEWLNHAN
jgi:hypothetical protein